MIEHEINKKVGIGVAGMLVFATVVALSFQHNNSITGAATGTTFNTAYGGLIFLILIGFSFFMIIEWALKRK